MNSSPQHDPTHPAVDLPTAADVRDAARRLAAETVRTPLLESPALNEISGGRILVKPEMLQRTGSFKFRGAYNCISRIEISRRRHGVVAFSSGNHAQGVAAAASLLGTPATIVMPADAPAIKTERTRAFGAEVIPYDRHAENREALAMKIANERGATIVRPYDDPYVIAGQGTVGLEIAEDLAARGIAPDAVLAPCGGGGLISGCALALLEAFPTLPIHAVEPTGFDDTRRSLIAGERVRNADGGTSRCDALLAATPGKLTFALNRRLLAGGIAVEERDVVRAMALAFAHLKLVIEPGGAVALAAALSDTAPGAFDCRGKTVVVICSGGNVDPKSYCEALREGAAALFTDAG